MFNPLGCRCKYGEFGVEETYRDPMFPEFGELGDYDDDEEERCLVCGGISTGDWSTCDCEDGGTFHIFGENIEAE